MTRRLALFRFVLTAALAVPILSGAREAALPGFTSLIDTEDVMGHVRALSIAIGARPMGSEAETRAAAYVAAAFMDWGYQVEVQAFETVPPARGEGEPPGPVTSRNVIATKPGDGLMVVVGAHLDSVIVGAGADDNASGIAAELAAARVLSGVDTAHTLVFIAFGAEERGDPSGAAHYVESLGDRTHDVIAMLNIDSVGAGTNLNVYAGAVVTWPAEGAADRAPTLEGGPTWVRDAALQLAADMGLPFGTTPADTWGGFTGDWGDHYPFVLAGVPIAYFEAWLWQGAANPWWGQETEDGDILHTEQDIYENVVPAKVEMTAELVAATIAAIATGAAAPPSQQREPGRQSSAPRHR